jgi:hypothetical protein
MSSASPFETVIPASDWKKLLVFFSTFSKKAALNGGSGSDSQAASLAKATQSFL